MNRTSLLTAVEFASRVIGRTTLPVLECLHLKGDGERLQVTGYNLDLYARMWVDSDLRIDCCASAKRLRAVLAAMTAEEVEITVLTDSLSVKGNGSAPVRTLPGEDFPPIPEIGGNRFPVPCDAIGRVLPSASTDETRYIVCGVCLDGGACIATDGKRLHSMNIDGSFDRVIIPAGAAKMLAEIPGTMSIKDGKFIASGDGKEIGGKLIDGNFPGWRHTIPKFPEGRPFPAAAVEAVERSMRLVDTGIVEIGPDSVSSGVAPDGHFEEVDTGVAAPIRINANYFLAALKAAGDGALLSITDGISPVGISNGGFLAVVMPMRIS